MLFEILAVSFSIFKIVTGISQVNSVQLVALLLERVLSPLFTLSQWQRKMCCAVRGGAMEKEAERRASLSAPCPLLAVPQRQGDH
jgi:hypothetical protein